MSIVVPCETVNTILLIKICQCQADKVPDFASAVLIVLVDCWLVITFFLSKLGKSVTL